MKNYFVSIYVLLASVTAFAGPWNANNDPSFMNAHYNYNFDALPMSARMDDQHMPWSDNYWESDWAGISLRWNTYTAEQLDPEGHEYLDKYSTFNYSPPSKEQIKSMSTEQLKRLSPAEKYDILMGRYDFPTVFSERARTSPDMKDWQGICHGWTPASMNYSEPLPTEATNPDGVTVPFGSTDVKALLSYYYAVTAYDYSRGLRSVIRSGDALQFLDMIDAFDLKKWLAVSSSATVYRNDTGYTFLVTDLNDTANCASTENISRFGTIDKCIENNAVSATISDLNHVSQIGLRPERGGHGINEPNAGAFHVVMSNQLGLLNHPFIANINKKLRNGEIWNQPVVGFNSQIESDRRGGNGGRVKMHTVLTYVTEIAQTWEPVVGTSKQRFAQMEFSYYLDIDGDGNITGGEWDNRSYHPSFAWLHDKVQIKGYLGKLNEIYHARF